MRAALLITFLAMTSNAEDKFELETGFSAGELAANAFILPLALAMRQPHFGFERRPYDGGQNYGRGDRDWGGTFRLSGQALATGRGGGHADVQVRGANRLGWQAGWDGYAIGALGSGHRADLWSGHITSNYLQSGHALLELGLGAASLRTDRTQVGPSAALLVELFPKAPWTLAARYQVAVLGGRSHHQVSARAGLSVRGIGAYAGYGAFFGPLGDARGPEAGLACWF